MSVRRLPPLFIWRLVFHLDTVQSLSDEQRNDLELQLHGYEARARVENGRIAVSMRVVGYRGPASAVSDAAQQLRHHAANVGISGEIEFVSARRIAARVPES